MPLAPTRIIPITRKALFFDGVDDYALATIPLVSRYNFTVIVYGKPLVAKNTTQNFISLWSNTRSVASLAYRLAPDQDFRFFYFAEDNSIPYLTTAYGQEPNIWHFFAFGVANGTNMFYWYDETKRTVTTASPPRDDITRVYIGQNGGNANYLNGDIAYVLIYNRALSDDEIAQIYNDPDHPPKSGLVLWLHDTSIDTENNVWRDLSGNGNDATIYGATAVDVVRPATRVINATRVIEPVR